MVSPDGYGTEMVDGERMSFAVVRFTLTRKPSGRNELISAYFLPTGLFALLSQVSFLIKPEIVRKICENAQFVFIM